MGKEDERIEIIRNLLQESIEEKDPIVSDSYFPAKQLLLHARNASRIQDKSYYYELSNECNLFLLDLLRRMESTLLMTDKGVLEFKKELKNEILAELKGEEYSHKGIIAFLCEVFSPGRDLDILKIQIYRFLLENVNSPLVMAGKIDAILDGMP